MKSDGAGTTITRFLLRWCLIAQEELWRQQRCSRSIFPNTTQMEEEEDEESWSSVSFPGRLSLACRATEGTDKDTIGLSTPRTSQFGL